MFNRVEFVVKKSPRSNPFSVDYVPQYCEWLKYQNIKEHIGKGITDWEEDLKSEVLQSLREIHTIDNMCVEERGTDLVPSRVIYKQHVSFRNVEIPYP